MEPIWLWSLTAKSTQWESDSLSSFQLTPSTERSLSTGRRHFLSLVTMTTNISSKWSVVVNPAPAIISGQSKKNFFEQVNGEKSPGEVFAEVSAAVSESIPLTDYLASLTVSSMDLGRLGGLPTCPIISIIGESWSMIFSQKISPSEWN